MVVLASFESLLFVDHVLNRKELLSPVKRSYLRLSLLNVFQIDMLLFIGNPSETTETKMDINVSNFPLFLFKVRVTCGVFMEMFSNSELNISVATYLKKLSLYIIAVFLY